ncbi:MAG: OmpA family protein, partial [Desulfuromusa sp.]|nr:OmpA family protein [Desulfuromusa sp.]
YEMQPYNKAKFAEAIDQLPTESKGPTLLQQGLSELNPILAGLKGHTVVFVMTDASYTDRGSDSTGQEVLEEDMSKPVNIAKALTEKYNVSFFVINSSSTEKEPEVIKALDSIGESTRVITFETLLNHPHVFSGALFVLNPKIVQKSVNIEKIIGVELNNLLFGFGQAEINPKYAEGMKLLGEYLQSAPGTRLSLSGFSDSTGPQEYNHVLSHRRVVNVSNYLIENFDISPDRISMSWYGAANPIASNATSEGRALNRRVEGFIY